MTYGNRGSSLIETLIAVSIFALIASGFVSATMTLGMSQLRAKIRSEAALIARESLEIAYNLSVQDWESFKALNQGEYYPAIDPVTSFYRLETGDELVINKLDMRRRVEIQPLVRDVNGDFVAPLSGQEPEFVKATAKVNWKAGPQTESIEYEIYLTNFEIK